MFEFLKLIGIFYIYRCGISVQTTVAKEGTVLKDIIDERMSSSMSSVDSTIEDDNIPNNTYSALISHFYTLNDSFFSTKVCFFYVVFVQCFVCIFS